jgi:hypothetical protein
VYDFAVEYGRIREFAVATQSASPAYDGPDAIGSWDDARGGGR